LKRGGGRSKLKKEKLSASEKETGVIGRKRKNAPAMKSLQLGEAVTRRPVKGLEASEAEGDGASIFTKSGVTIEMRFRV